MVACTGLTGTSFLILTRFEEVYPRLRLKETGCVVSPISLFAPRL